MALLGQGGSGPIQGAKPAEGKPVDNSTDAEKDAAFKAKKNEAAKRHQEKRRKEAQDRYEASLKLRDYLTAKKAMDDMPKELKDFVVDLCTDPATKRATGGGGFGGPSVFSVLFGNTPKVGDSITLEEAFNRTYKGKATLDVWVKRWAEKGIVVECNVNPSKMLASTYTVKALPAA